VLAAVVVAASIPTVGMIAFYVNHADRRDPAGVEKASWFSSSLFGGRPHLGTGKVLVRFDRNRLARGALFLDDVDLKSSTTGIVVRSPGVISLRSAVPGMFHDWRPTEYCKIVVHPNEITVIDVLLNGRTERAADGTLVSRPTCKCLIQTLKDKPNDSNEIPTCE
jgi:hypothetical protein